MNRRRVVSNPLGWDGDFDFPYCFFEFEEVSNPLGWDGDVSTRAIESTPRYGF